MANTAAHLPGWLMDVVQMVRGNVPDAAALGLLGYHGSGVNTIKKFDPAFIGTGEGAWSAYGLLSEAVGGPKNASALLMEYGVPGVRYFDRGPLGERVRNFVVFPGQEDLLKIIGRE